MAVDHEMVRAYLDIGRQIIAFEQGGGQGLRPDGDERGSDNAQNDEHKCEKGDCMMSDWVNVTSSFPDEKRSYRNTWLEICEVLDDTIECSLFSSPDGPYEIYVSFGPMYGVSYAAAGQAAARRDRMKAEIEAEHRQHGNPTPEFINAFARKYELNIENALFDSGDLMDTFWKMFE